MRAASFRRLPLVFAAAFALGPLCALAQSAPNWNVTLPGQPGTAVQTVSLAAGTLTVERKFEQGSFHFAVPLKTVSSITEPFLYQKNWLIDLHLSKNVTAVNKMNVGMVQTRTTDDVSVMFLSKPDAAGGRAYLLSRLHS